MIEKTEALTLRVTPFARTSHIVTWLTSEHGKLATLVKGACRPKSRFLGQYDLFYTCELLFYTRERNALHIIRECSPMKPREALRTNWMASSYASYVCDLVARVSPEGQQQAELYQLAVSSLDFLCAGTAKPQFLSWFELKLMKTLGLAPQLLKCPACRSNLVSHRSGQSLFSCVRGGILCADCAKRRDPSTGSTSSLQAKLPSNELGTGGTDRSTFHISPDILAMMRSWQNADSARTAQNTKCTREQLLEIRKLLGIFLNYHLDMMPRSRNVALEMTDTAVRTAEDSRPYLGR